MKKLSYKVMILDDNPDSLQFIVMLLQDLYFIDKMIVIKSDPIEAFEYLCHNEVDILLLDIDLGRKDINGLNFAQMVPQPPVMAICSGHSKYRNAANEALIFHQFGKTTSRVVLKALMEELAEKVDQRELDKNRDVTTLQLLDLERNKIEIVVNDIYYAVINHVTVSIYLKDKSYKCNMSMRKFQEQLPAHKFARSMKNTLVNLDKVTLIQSKQAHLIEPMSATPCAVSQEYNNEFRRKWQMYKQQKHFEE